jgi:MFS family permease
MVSLATDQSVSEASASTELARNWPALVVAVWGASVGITGLIFYSFSTFVPLFQEREGWSRTQVAIGLSLGALGIMIAAPIVGRLVDRYGPRRILLISIPLLAIGFTLPSFAGGSPWTLWIAYLGLALIGMGASPVAYGRLVVTRFRKARGLALGFMLAGTGVSALLVPPFLAAVTQSYRITGGYLGLALLALTPWILIVAFVRDADPEAPQASAAQASQSPIATGGFGLSFFLIAVAFAIVSVGLTGVVVHLVAMMRDAGLTATQAGIVAGGVGVGVICARIVIGWILDNVYAPFVALGVFVLSAAGCLLLAYGGTDLAIVAAALIGVALGGEIDLIAYLVSRYFAQQHFAAIYGWQFGIFTVAASVSPLAIEALRGVDGSYAMPLTFAAVAVAVGGLPLLFLGKYRY